VRVEAKGVAVPEDERIDEETPSAGENEEVEAHGAKQVAGIGLAAAALIGAGAVGVNLATDDDQSRNQGALVSEQPVAERLARADTDQDGYVTYRDLANEEVKVSAQPLRDEGIDVADEALAAAGAKIELKAIGEEGGFGLEGDTIMIESKVDSKVDEVIEGPAMEWMKKFKEIDQDGDGYASTEELEKAGYTLDFWKIREAGYEVSTEELSKSGITINLASFGEGGFVTKENMVMVTFGVDDKVDAFIKGEGE
jgi:Ca2+-binding EF-hand superfamily protein